MGRVLTSTPNVPIAKAGHVGTRRAVTALDELPQVLRVEQFIDDCRTLDPNQFRARHGNAFLVHYGAIDKLRRPEQPQPTQIFKDQTPFLSGSSLRMLKSDYLVYPIHSTGRSPYPRMITVGRTRNNDIVLPDESVSKFHAFFREPDETAPPSEASAVLLQDAGSRNGTLFNGAPVPTAKLGNPIVVSMGGQVRFGLVELTFLDAVGLRELVAHVSR
jgi:hypothetical protein